MASGVEFDEDGTNFGVKPPSSAGQASNSFSPSNSYTQQRYPNTGSQSGMTAFLMRHGLAKSPKKAQTYLVILVIANIIITFVVIKYFL